MGSIEPIYGPFVWASDVDALAHTQSAMHLAARNENVNNSVARFMAAHINRAISLLARARPKHAHTSREHSLCWHQAENIRSPNASTESNQDSVLAAWYGW